MTTCTQNRQPFFDNFQCARLLISEMKKLEKSNQVVSITWVIMPDHLHWLFQLSCVNTLSTIMQKLKAAVQKISINIIHKLIFHGSEVFMISA
ncbi:MAG: transposase [Colwellia sp.]